MPILIGRFDRSGGLSMVIPKPIVRESTLFPAAYPAQPSIRVTRDSREAVVGTVAVAVLLAGGRWVSHLSLGPVYISDVLVVVAVVRALFSRPPVGQRGGRAPGAAVLIGLVVVVTLVRLLTADGDMRVAARDAAPFIYVTIGYFSARAALLASEAARRRTVRLLHGALVIHFGWVTLALLVPGFGRMLPQLGGVQLFEIRPDFDTAMLGVLAGVSILRFRHGNGAWLNASLMAATLASALALGSRAGLLACAACVLVALAMRPQRGRRTALRTVVLGISVVLLLSVFLPSSPSSQRLLATVDSSATSQEITGSAQGTYRARQIAWERSTQYTLDDEVRTLIGVGFGSDFLRASDADLALGRGIGVRSPHNYLLTTFARLGLIGLTLVAALLIAVFMATARALGSGGADELARLCVLLVTAIPVTAMLGVVLESPFGAIPFYWAGGILLAHKHRRHDEREAGGRTHA
ncbi:O-antigen ligase family protein [Streptomyces sp. NPDC005146]